MWAKNKNDDKFDASSTLMIDKNNIKEVSGSEIPMSTSDQRQST